MADKPLHVRTPLVESTPLSQITGCKVYLKLETAQPIGCFKIRGIGHLMKKAVEQGNRKFVASSGGNAGMAAAYAARQLGVPINIYVPETTPQFVRERLQMEGAKVTVAGSVWDEANAKAMEEAQQPDVFAVHPFDHPDIWDGHASMIEEIADDMTTKPDLVITSVGGGGLALGILKGLINREVVSTIYLLARSGKDFDCGMLDFDCGLERVGWADVPLLCMETDGAHCLNAAVKANQLVTLSAITSIAKCLGALTVAKDLFEATKSKPVISCVISDAECLQAVMSYLGPALGTAATCDWKHNKTDDHKCLVEPACGAAIAAIYTGAVKRLQEQGVLGQLQNIVLIVCGGMCVNLNYIDEWHKQLGVARA